MSKPRRAVSSGAHRRWPLTIFLLVAAFLVVATCASAKETRIVESSFGTGELSLGTHSGVAVNDATHDVYVADSGHGAVARFKADGTPIASFASLSSPTFIAVDNSGGASQGAVYVVTAESEIAKFSASGAPEMSWGTAGVLSGFPGIAGIAVGQTGTLFVLQESSAVHGFSPAGVEQVSFTAPRGTRTNGLAVDSAENLYKVDGTPEVTKFNAAGTNLSDNLTGREDAAALGLDSATDDLYVVNGGFGALFVSVFEVNCGERCSAKEEFGGGELGNPSAVAIDAASGAVYVADAGTGRVNHFGSPVIVPDVTVEAATELTPKKATLHGSVNPDGLAVTECKFEYVAEGDPASSVPCQGAIPTDESSHPVEAAITGLKPNTTYTVRLIARNANGKNASTAGNFTTASTAGAQPATEITTTGATLNGLVAPEGEAVTECFFEYGETESFGSTAPCVGAIPADEGVHPVQAAIGGLAREGHYFFRLVVKQAGGEAQSTVQSFESAGARVSEEVPHDIGVSEATLEATIDPRGLATSYFFEYGPSIAYGEQTEPETVDGAETVAQTIGDLAAKTAYHWRIVVTDSFGEVDGADHIFETQSPIEAPETGCPNQVFRSGVGAFLSDCRAYEQASPVNKNGGGVQAAPGTLRASEDGNGVTFFSQAGFPGGVGAQEVPTFLGSRRGGAWTTQGLLPPQALGEQASYIGLTPNFDYAIAEATLEGKTAVFARNLGNGAVTMVVPYQPGCEGGCFTLAGASADGSKIFLETRRPLTAGKAGEETPPGQPNLFVWDRGTGEISLVDVGTNGEPLPEGGFAGPYVWFGVLDKRNGGSAENLYTSAIHAISTDGDQVVFTEAGEEEGHTQLFVRRGLNGPSPASIQVSAYQDGLEGAKRPAVFLEATPDGRYVFFKSKAELTSDANNGIEEESWNLYRFEVPTEELIDLTPDPANLRENGPGVLGMLGSSASGDSAYFTATAALTTAPSPTGESPVPGEANLYRYEAGVSQPLSLVAVLQNGGQESPEKNDTSNWSPITTRQGSNLVKVARVSTDGQIVVFSSHHALTNVPNSIRGCNGGSEPGSPSEPCAEFFRYSNLAHSLACLSCDPNGALPRGSATIGTREINVGEFPANSPAPALPRNLSADGDRFFFQTPDSLLARDVNAKSGCPLRRESGLACLDVYEWEAPGTGSCSQAVVDGGCLYLISSGEGDHPSYFADADREGKNVFVLTESQLVPADRDQLYDVYDASEGGGLASQNEPPPVRCVSQGACQGPLVGPEAGTTPGSSTFTGPGNPKSAKCKGAKKCKQQHKKKSRKHKKKHAKKRTARHGRGGAK